MDFLLQLVIPVTAITICLCWGILTTRGSLSTGFWGGASVGIGLATVYAWVVYL